MIVICLISWSYRNQGFYLILLQTSTMISVCLQKLDSCLIFYEIKLHFIYIYTYYSSSNLIECTYQVKKNVDLN